MGPIAGIKFVHNAIRSDLGGIAQGASSNAVGMKDRFSFLRLVLRVHEQAEEKHLFPAIDKAVPGSSAPYIGDHRNNGGLMDTLEAALAAGDAPKAAAAGRTLNSEMNAHLDREETDLWPLCDAHIQPAAQGALVGQMAGEIPLDQMPKVVAWLMNNLGQDDREGLVRMWQAGLPAPAFAGVVKLIQANLSPSDWQNLSARVPISG